ncbi:MULTISPECIES: hypothetical protein [Dysgonomonas]|uniref:Uncharacterized protein n=1 Tax=Dysgonomonas capnocytophagoides TaxID=45254 RepID=A0A4Y8L6R9_9BACT|nr:MULTISPECIES: hypothetical protein [Dysgonomonas]MBS7119491.1 hypothetical protein [Dysgonomonas sp.]TFD96186.1 hypothetical protein E2605_11375 [Dysgonomonas capnocytophagoides]
MNKNIITGIEKHTGYNTGGISNIFLLDIRSFIAYRFTDDMLFDECFVESVRISDYNYMEVETIESSKFQESMDNGIYKQQLTTFVRKLEAAKTSNLLKTNTTKYLVMFKTYENKYFCFGSDGGATVSFSQISGEIGGSSGYNLTINKSSVYPLFQINFNNRIIESLLTTENNQLITTEDNYFIPILELWKK